MKSRGRWVYHQRRVVMDNNNIPARDRYQNLDSQLGLLLEHNESTKTYRVRNPSTMKTIVLPDPGKHLLMWEMQMCHMRCSNALKLAVPGKKGNLIVCKVLTVGIDIAWRDIDIPFPNNVIAVNFQESVMAGEAYFMSYGLELICVEMGDERVSLIVIPSSSFSIGSCIVLREWGGRLALVSVVEADDVHVWVLEDREKIKWAQEKIVVPLKFMYARRKGKMTVIIRFIDDVLLVACDPDELMSLDVPFGKIRSRHIAPRGHVLSYYYTPSLHHPSLGASTTVSVSVSV